MPAPSPKVVALEKQRDAHQKSLAKLQAELDDAADRDDKALVVQIQSEVIAAEILIKSTERRLAAALTRETAEARAARQTENEAAAKFVANELAKRAQMLQPVIDTIRKLAKQIEPMRSSGRAAREAAASLVRQLPMRQRDVMGLWGLLHEIEGPDAINATIGALFHAHGIDLPVLVGPDSDPAKTFADRAEKLAARVDRVLAEANKGI